MSGHKFRIGSTSYVYPADLEPNVRQLAGVVDDVELVLFDTDGYGSNVPDPATISALNAIARDHALTFTVHLPVDIAYNDPIAWGKVQRAVDATRALHPFAYVAHLEGHALISSPSPQVVSQWQAEAARALDQVITFIGDRQRICIENVERWEPEHFRNLVADAGVQRCIDIGHWWVNQRDP
ncbi:MAG: TIM barrel protein, partial [Chloroflexi bacterium]|nr:TIM barrel protein [Chloroflexota bacterium]